MGLKLTRSGPGVPALEWTEQHMGLFAEAVASKVKRRAFDEGRGLDDQAHAPYSTKPMTVSFASETAQRLKPKGGLPAYGRGHPRSLLGAAGRQSRGQGWTITGRYFPGGYAEYKRSSRTRSAAARAAGMELVSSAGLTGVLVDLTLSGNLRNKTRVVSHTRTTATIGITGDAQLYGVHVNAKRPWLGLSPGDIAEGGRLLAKFVEMGLRPRGGSRGPR